MAITRVEHFAIFEKPVSTITSKIFNNFKISNRTYTGLKIAQTISKKSNLKEVFGIFFIFYLLMVNQVASFLGKSSSSPFQTNNF